MVHVRTGRTSRVVQSRACASRHVSPNNINLFACPTTVLVRIPTDWTNSRTFILVLVLGQVLQAWLASFRSLRESSTRRGRRTPLPETVRTGNLKLQPTIPDHTLHDMTCRPVFCTAVRSSSSSTTCDFYSCIPIRLLRWHIRS